MRICITRTEKDRYSETFLLNQIKELASHAEIFPVHGGRLPQRNDDNTLLSSRFFWIMHNIAKTVSGKRNNYFGNHGLKNFLEKNKIDIVLANYGFAAVHMLPVCKALNLPLVVHFHGFDATQQKILKQYNNAYKILFKEAAGIIAVSADMKNKLVALGADENKISLIPYGIDVQKFSPAYPKKQEALFLCVGRLIGKKSPQSTIQAFAKTKQVYTNAKLIMIGEKSGLYENCVHLVKSLGIENDVVFTGIQNAREVINYMHEANIFVQHSVTAANGDMEGTPNTILEAAACALPVVSTKHAGIKEAVINGKTGFLVDEHDVNGMAKYMIELIEKPLLAKEMGFAGRRHIEENYDLHKQSKKLYDVLEQAVNKRHENE